MKIIVRLLALICALVVTASLAACGEKKDVPDDTASESAPESNTVDHEWVKFDLPDGWAETKSTGVYAAASENADPSHIVKISYRSYSWENDLQEVVKKFVEYDADRYKTDASATIGGHKYYPLRYKYNSIESVLLYCELDSEHYCEISIAQMKETDPAIQTILNSIEFDPTKIK